MPQKRDKPPHIEVIVTARGIRPHTVDDAEKLVRVPQRTVYQLVPVTKRSWPQLKTYWKALGIVVKSTNKWPSAEKLSDELKWVCGYRTRFVDWQTGEIRERPDSIALDQMSHEEFCTYFDLAMAKLAEHVGFDPLSFLADAA